jgi:hypothetical protein
MAQENIDTPKLNQCFICKAWKLEKALSKAFISGQGTGYVEKPICIRLALKRSGSRMRMNLEDCVKEFCRVFRMRKEGKLPPVDLRISCQICGNQIGD